MSSLLETFYILIKSNAKDVKKDQKELAKSTDDLQHSFLDLGKSLAEMAAAYFTVSSTVHNLRDSFDYQLQLSRASQALDVNVQDLDAWGRAVERAGGSTQGFQQSLVQLAQHLNIQYKDVIKILPQLAKTFEGKSKDNLYRFGTSIGMDPALISLLEKGQKSVEAIIARQKQLRGITAENAAGTQKFAQDWYDTMTIVAGVWDRVVDSIIPKSGAIVGALQQIGFFFQKNPDLIIGALIAIAAAFGAAAISIALANAEILGFIAAASLLYTVIKQSLGDPDSLISDFVRGIQRAAQDTVAAFQWVNDRIHNFIQRIKEDIQEVIDFFKKLTHLYDNAHNYVKGKEHQMLSGIVNFAKGKINDANSSSINSQTSQRTFNASANHRSVSVNTGPITIQTQATDGKSIGADFGKGLTDHIREATTSFDDGVQI